MSLDKFFPAEIDMRSSPRTFAKFAVLGLALFAGFGLAAVPADEQSDVIVSHFPANKASNTRRFAISPSHRQPGSGDDGRGDVVRG